MKNKVEDLRNHLFATIEALRDKDEPMEIERARAIADVAQTIINSAKVEVEMAKTLGRGPAGGFIPLEQPPEPARPSVRALR